MLLLLNQFSPYVFLIFSNHLKPSLRVQLEELERWVAGNRTIKTLLHSKLPVDTDHDLQLDTTGVGGFQAFV
jgi:hypothetical protein